jgi:hypothetical protein
MRNTRGISMLAAAQIAALGAGLSLGAAFPAARLRDDDLWAKPYRPSKPKRDTELQREIADHNEAVEARKAAKKARKALKEPP